MITRQCRLRGQRIDHLQARRRPDGAVDFRLGGRQPGENAPEATRVLAQRGLYPLVAGRRRVSLVEDEIDGLEHRLESWSELGAGRDLEWHARCGQRALGPDD